MGITVDWKKVVPGFLKIGVHATAKNPVGVITGAIDTANAFSWSEPAAPTAEEGARLLLLRATYAAAMRTIGNFAKDAPMLASEAAPAEMEAELVGLVPGAKIELTADAFAHPERWPALDTIESAFGHWQKICGVKKEVSERMHRAFRDEVPLALQSELRDESKQPDYAALLLDVYRETIMDDAAERARHWIAYRSRLVEAVHKPLRSLAPEKIPRYSLSDLYIPLRAAPVRAATTGTRQEGAEVGDKEKRPVVWLHDALLKWIAAPRRDDTIRVLSGDPGAGKSSACAMLAAELARSGRRVLLIPLGRLDYNGETWGELSRYVHDELGHDALESIKSDPGEPLILILDGLDELAKAGQGAAEIVGQFTASLERRVLDINRDTPRLLLLLAGRPGATTATGAIARADGARLETLRYVLEPWERNQLSGSLIDLDQRNDW